jgi:amino acid transporter
MAEPRVGSTPGLFVRQSSGLVRDIGTRDTIFYGLNAITIAYVTFTMTSWAFYPGASYEWSTVLTTVGAIGVGVVYALLAGVYPRSGGEYVFLSRIVRPDLGFVVSFVQTFWYIFYFGVNGAFFSIYGLAPMFSTLGLQTGNTALTNIGAWFAQPTGIFVAGTAVLVLVAFMIFRGMRSYFTFQRWGTIIGLASAALTILVLALGAVGVFHFQASFDALAGSGSFQKVVTGVTVPGYTLPATLNFMVWPAFSIIFSVNMVAFSGEIKHIGRGPLLGIVGSMLLAGLIFIAFMFFARGAMSDQFMIGAVTTTSFPLPIAPFINSLASILVGNPLLTILMNLWVILIIPYALGSNIIYASRALLAWSIDGIAPTKLGEVSERYHSPVVAILVVAVLSEVWLIIYAFTTLVTVLSGLLGFSIAFLVVSLTGIAFPYVKREVFERSPAAVRVGGVPVITIAAVVGAVFSGFLFYRAIVDQTFGASTTFSIEVTVAAFVGGFVWFYGARMYRRGRGTPVDNVFKEIPIE